MAAVTVAQSALTQRHVIGDLVVRFFIGISGASGSTLNTGLGDVLYVSNQPFTTAGTASLITGIAVTAIPPSVSPGGSFLTLTSSGPMVSEVIMVIGRIG